MKHHGIEILHADEDLIVVFKPSGLLSIPDRYNRKLPSASKILESIYGEIFIVHRLDRYTSGIMVFAKNAPTHQNLNEQFSKRIVRKTYLLLVLNHTLEKGVIDVNISPHPYKNKMVVTKKGGKSALTEYSTLENFGQFSLVRAEPKTGRTHQLRVHFAHLGHEIIGDEVYGTFGPLYLSQFKTNYRPSQKYPEKPLIGRLALHAESLEFQHHNSGKKRFFESPLPKDFKAAINQLQKWN